MTSKLHATSVSVVDRGAALDFHVNTLDWEKGDDATHFVLTRASWTGGHDDSGAPTGQYGHTNHTGIWNTGGCANRSGRLR